LNPVSLALVPTRLKTFAVAAGQRLQKPGKEVLTGTGTLLTDSNGTQKTAAASIVWQIPLKIQVNAGSAPLIFDQASTASQAAQDNSDLLETLVDDSVEGLISMSNQGGATRLLGTAFREQGAAQTAPAYDIVQMLYADVLKKGRRSAKAYWFDSATKLLAKVTYLSDSGSPIEVTVGNWQKVQGENIPFLVERRDNGVLTLRLSLSSASVAAAPQGGTLGGN
jgi:hypothetical protein